MVSSHNSYYFSKILYVDSNGNYISHINNFCQNYLYSSYALSNYPTLLYQPQSYINPVNNDEDFGNFDSSAQEDYKNGVQPDSLYVALNPLPLDSQKPIMLQPKSTEYAP